MSRLRSVIAVVVGASLTVFGGCDDATAPAVPDGYESLWDVLLGGGAYEKVEPADVVTGSSSAEETKGDGSVWSCVTESRSVVDAPQDYATFNPNAEVLYPGSMLQGKTLTAATPEPIVVHRAGGTFVINLLNGSSSVSQTVDEVKQSTVVQAINDIIASNTASQDGGIMPARFTYTSTEVQSHEQLALSLRVDVNTLTTDFRSQLSFSSDREYNRFLVRLTQSFYTVSFDLPLSLDDLFAADVTPDDLARYVGPGNPATYISSVTYGRTFFLLIESTSSAMEMQAAIRTSYDAAVVDVDVAAQGNYVKDLANVNIKVFALGGDQSKALAVFNGDFEELRKFLTEGANIRTGVPLSYVTRNVVDNSVIGVKVATDYDVKNCTLIAPAELVSDFGTSTEGWSSLTNGSGRPIWNNETQCGNELGGCVKMGDASGGYYLFRAPHAWTDESDWSTFYDGAVEYWMKLYANPTSDASTSVPDVTIEGRNGVLRFYCPRALWPNTNWQQFFIPIREGDLGMGQNVVWMDGSGIPATEAYIKDVLSSVTDLFIRGEYRVGGSDYAWLDAVRISR